MLRGSPHDSNLDSIFWIPASVAIHDIQTVTGIQVVHSPFSIDHESLVLHLDIDTSPPDIIRAGLLINDPFVFG